MSIFRLGCRDKSCYVRVSKKSRVCSDCVRLQGLAIFDSVFGKHRHCQEIVFPLHGLLVLPPGLNTARFNQFLNRCAAAHEGLTAGWLRKLSSRRQEFALIKFAALGS